MLERKGIEHKTVWLLPGLWPFLLRTRGFRGGTVPAMKIDGRRLQSSRAISRALEEVKPDPPLFPADPERRHTLRHAPIRGSASTSMVFVSWHLDECQPRYLRAGPPLLLSFPMDVS